MIRDHSLTLSKAQPITTSVVSRRGTEPLVIDFLPTGTPYGSSTPLKRNQGIGACLPFLIQVVETFEGAGTLDVQMQFSATENFASPKTVWSSGPIALQDLVAGANLGIVDTIPKGVLDEGPTLRFMRMNYVVANGPFTAGKITAGAVMSVQHNPL